MNYRTWVEISKAALINNIEQFLKIIGPNVRFGALLKANAYGHGLIEVAKIVSDYKKERQTKNEFWFGVDSLEEGSGLRKAGFKEPILAMGYIPKDRLGEVAKNDLRIFVYDTETISALAKLNQSIKVHLKIDTGMSRLGVQENDALELAKLIKQTPNLELEGIATHLAKEEDPEFSKRQFDIFNKVLSVLKNEGIEPLIIHTAKSAVTAIYLESHFNLVRIGGSLYGLWGNKAEIKPENLNVQPVCVWKTKIAQIKKIKKGTRVSYSLTEKVERDSVVAILPVGYYDGYDRGLSGIGQVLIKEKFCKVLGRVCMNMTIVDITDVLGPKVENEVVLLGQQGGQKITAEDIAQRINTNNYEITTRINPLLPRIII